MSLNNLSKDDINFLEEYLKGFYRQVIKLDNYANFEKTLTEWTKDFFSRNKKDSKKVLELMEIHKENKIWFSSLIGFFYDYGMENIIDVDKNKSLIRDSREMERISLMISGANIKNAISRHLCI